MEKSVYMHSINHTLFKSKRDINKLDQILGTRSLLSLRNQGINYSSTFSGLDYISLCDYEKKDVTNRNLSNYNSYYAYIRRGLSLAFRKDVIDKKYDVLYPTVIDAKNQRRIIGLMMLLGEDEKRYTDLPDEVQIKGSISLDDLEYVTYPCDEFLMNMIFRKKDTKRKKLIEELTRLKNVLFSNGKDIKIYDIDSGIELNEEGIERVLKLK